LIRHPWLAALGAAVVAVAIAEAVLLYSWSKDSRAPSQDQLLQFGLKQSETEAELQRTRQQLSQSVLALAENERNLATKFKRAGGWK